MAAQGLAGSGPCSRQQCQAETQRGLILPRKTCRRGGFAWSDLTSEKPARLLPNDRLLLRLDTHGQAQPLENHPETEGHPDRSKERGGPG